MAVGLTGKVPQAHRAVVGGAVVDCTVPQALEVEWPRGWTGWQGCPGLVVKYEALEVPHALAAKSVAELGDLPQLTRHQ